VKPEKRRAKPPRKATKQAPPGARRKQGGAPRAQHVTNARSAPRTSTGGPRGKVKERRADRSPAALPRVR
jgi:hypothetical protein